MEIPLRVLQRLKRKWRITFHSVGGQPQPWLYLEVLMVPKERLMTALHKGKPDRLPISVHQWQAYHLKYYLNGISALEAFQKFGMDAQIQYFGDVVKAPWWIMILRNSPLRNGTMKLPWSAATPTTEWPIMPLKRQRGC